MKIFASLFLVALSASVIGSRADDSDCDHMIKAFTLSDLTKIPRLGVRFYPEDNFTEKMTLTGPVKLSNLHTIMKKNMNTMLVKFTSKKNNFEASLHCDPSSTVTPGCRPTFDKLFTLDAEKIKKCQKDKRWKEAAIKMGDTKESITFTTGGVVSLIYDLCDELVERITKSEPNYYRVTTTVPDHVFTPNPKFLTWLTSRELTLSDIHQVLTVPSKEGSKIALLFKGSTSLQAELLFPPGFKKVEYLATNNDLLTKCKHGAGWVKAIFKKDHEGNIVFSANGKEFVIYEPSDEASGGHDSRGHVRLHEEPVMGFLPDLSPTMDYLPKRLPEEPVMGFLPKRLPEDSLPSASSPPVVAFRSLSPPRQGPPSGPPPPLPSTFLPTPDLPAPRLPVRPGTSPSPTSRGRSPSPPALPPKTGSYHQYKK